MEDRKKGLKLRVKPQVNHKVKGKFKGMVHFFKQIDLRTQLIDN